MAKSNSRSGRSAGSGPREKPDGSSGLSPSGHNRLVGQPHTAAEGPVAQAEETAARMISHDHPVGPPGPPFDRRSPFLIAVLATLGVAVTYAVLQLFAAAAQVFLLIGLALFLAVGLEPAVSWLVGRGFKRGLAVLTVIFTVLAAIAGFIAAAVPPLVEQVRNLIDNLPTLTASISDNSTLIGKVNEQINLQENVENLLKNGGAGLAGGVLGFGVQILSGVGTTILALVFIAYFLADMPRIRRNLYRLVPASRRPRVILIGDQIVVKVGAYVLGNLALSLVTGAVTFLWLWIFDIPYPLLLAILVALVDLIPVVGSTIGGVIVSLVALSVSVPVAVATLAFYIVYQSLEGYIIVPWIMGKAVRVPAMVTAVGVVIGGAMLGLVGALVAIPLCAALLLILREVAHPRLDRM